MLTHGILVSSEYWTNNFVRVYYFVTLLMYTREYLIALFFPAQHPYWFVSVLPHNPILFLYPYFPNPIPFPPKNIETKVEMRFFRPFPSVFIASYKCGAIEALEFREQIY